MKTRQHESQIMNKTLIQSILQSPVDWMEKVRWLYKLSLDASAAGDLVLALHASIIARLHASER